MKLFFRYSYSQINADGTFFSDSLQLYQSKNYSRNYVGGADFTTGSWTHSFRISYLKFQNEIADGVIGSALPLSDFPGKGQYVNLNVVNGPSTGPNLLAPQSTPQSDKQFKYDGSKTVGKHILRYGVDYNHIQGGGFASFFALAPQIGTTKTILPGRRRPSRAAWTISRRSQQSPELPGGVGGYRQWPRLLDHPTGLRFPGRRTWPRQSSWASTSPTPGRCCPTSP